MISTELSNKLPGKVFIYAATKFLLPILIFCLLLSFVTKNMSIGVGVFLFIFFFLGLPVLILLKLKFSSFSFIITENSLTTHSGIFAKRTTAIPFAKIQSVDCISGLLLGFYDLSVIRVWTAAPDQVTITDGNSSAIPEITIWLDTKDAEWLLSYLLGGRETAKKSANSTPQQIPTQTTVSTLPDSTSATDNPPGPAAS